MDTRKKGSKTRALSQSRIKRTMIFLIKKDYVEIMKIIYLEKLPMEDCPKFLLIHKNPTNRGSNNLQSFQVTAPKLLQAAHHLALRHASCDHSP